MSWPLVNLESVAHINPRLPKGTDESQVVTFLKMASVSEGGELLEQEKRILSETKKGFTYFEKDDVLLAKITPCFENGKAALLDDLETQLGFGSTEFHVLRAVEGKLDSKYLFHLVWNEEFRFLGKHAMKGAAGQQRISTDFLKNLRVPLPPLEIQKQIAAVLEKADQLRKDCQQMEQELNSLAQAVFIDMFGDPVTNPKEWDKAPLSAIVDEFLGGKSLVAADDQNTEYKNRVLKISAVTSGEFKPRESKPLPNDYEPQVEHFVKAGDLLFSRANTTELVGATTMVFDEHTGLVLPDKLWRFVWKEEKSLSPVFIWQQLCEAGVRKEISKLSSGSGGSMKNISKGKLNTLQIIFPPLELQQKFERFYLKLRVELSNNQQQIKFADQTFNALMQKAFKGELNL